MIRKILTILPLIFITLSSSGQSAYRYLFLEHFTNTRCSLCPGRNATLHTTLDNNPGVVHHISYHPSVPYSNCVLYQHNTVDNNARKTQYGVSFTPQAFLWGTSSRAGTTLLPQGTITANINQTAPLQIMVDEGSSSIGKSATITVKTMDTPPTGNVRLFAAIVERHLSYNAPNGETNHYNVFRKMLPSKDGEAFTPANLGESISFTYDYEIDAEWDDSEIYVLAFVQDMSSDEVINSGMEGDLRLTLSSVNADTTTGSATVDIQGGIPPYTILWNDQAGQTTATANNLEAGEYIVTVTDSVGVVSSDVVTVEGSVSIEDEISVGLKIFPNPVKDELEISFEKINTGKVQINLFNQQGQLVHKSQELITLDKAIKLSVTKFPVGVYYLDILVEEKRFSKKILVE